MKNRMGIIGRAALLAALAFGPALAIRPGENVLSGVAEPGKNPYRTGFKKMKRLARQHLLEPGEALKDGKVDLRGDAPGQILKRLNQRLKQAGGEVRISLVQTDPLGNKHVRLLQYHRGVPVIGSDMVIHVNAADEVYATGGSLAEGLAADPVPTLKAEQVRARARAALRATHAAVERQAPRLVVFDDALAYEMILEEPGSPPALWRAYVDAGTGTLLHRENRIVHGAPVGGAAHPVTGSALTGEGGGPVTISGWKDGGSIYFLHNQTSRWGVFDQVRLDWSQNATGDWGVTDRAAVSLGRNLELTQRYAADILGRDGYDDAGTLAMANVHVGEDFVNAYWDGSAFYFGDGDGVTANPLTVLDVAAHEFGHAVTQYTSDLQYEYESGALNESFSDILGALVEFRAQPDGRAAYPAGQDGRADYLMGEDCWLDGEAARDMRNPGRFGQPSYYLGTNWYSGSGDNGGVHFNSGVQNFAFYLLAEGGSGSNDGHPYAVTGLGVQAAGAIAMYANMYLLTGTSQYRDAREAWGLAASTLGYNEQTVRDVWTACGVLEQVNNLSVSPANLAFGNVGVGSPAILELTLSNNGALTTFVTGLTFDNPAFSSAAPLPLAVPGGSSVALPVRFVPAAMGSQAGQLTLASTADGNPSFIIPLAGTGTAPAGISVAPASLDAAVAVGDTLSRSVVVTNTGVADLVFTPRTAEHAHSARPLVGGKRVLFLHAGGGFAGFHDSLAAFPNVDSLADLDGNLSLPTASRLAAHDVVVVASNAPWTSPAAVGDLLADYVDGGGAVILLGASFYLGGSWALEGRIMSPDYAPIGGFSYSFDSTASASLADHPINQGVSSLFSYLWVNCTSPQGQGVSLGTYRNGFHLGAYNPGKPVVSLNVLPMETYYGGDFIRQVRNSIDFLGSGDWLRLAGDGASRRVAQGESDTLAVTLDARHIPGGEYTGTIELSHNASGFANPLVIPVTFAVDGFRRLSASAASLAFGNRRLGSRDSLALVLTNAGDEATALSAFEFDNPEFRLSGAAPALLPGKASVTVQVVFAPQDLGPETGRLTIRSNAEDNPVIAVSLSGTGRPAPQVSVSPASFALTLPTGSRATRNLVISNAGGTNLVWRLEGARRSLGAAGAAGASIATRHPDDATTIDILAWVPYTDMTEEFANMVAALGTGANPFTLEISSTFSPQILEEELADREVFLMPERELGNIPAGTGSAFGQVLRDFVDRGGLVVMHHPNRMESETFMREAGLMDFATGMADSFGDITLAEPSHPLFAGISPPLTMQNLTAGFTLRDNSTALATFGGHAVVAERILGRGRVLLIGPDFYEYTPNWARVLCNAVNLAPTSAQAWLSASMLSDTLPPGESRTVTLTADAAGMISGIYAANLTLTHNAPASPNPLSIPFTLTVDGIRSLSVEPFSLDFGNVWQGTVAHRTLTLTNPGSESTTITALDFDNQAFRCTTGLPLVIAPFRSATVTVDFTAGAQGRQDGVLVIESDAEDRPVLGVVLAGTGTLPPVAALAPSAMAFDLSPADAPADRTATLTNSGGDRLRYRIASVMQTGSPGSPVPMAAPGQPPVPDLVRVYAPANQEEPHAPGEVIVALKPGRQGLAASSLLGLLGARDVRELAAARKPGTGLRSHAGRRLLLLKLDPQAGGPLSAAIARLKQDANVAYAEPNFIRRLAAVPDDPSFGSLYGMHNSGQLGGRIDADIDASEAWDRHTGNRSLVLGLIDTGIDWLHPDLAANVWTNAAEQAGIPGQDDDGNGYVDDVHGYDFINGDPLPMDDNGHGTHCAGTIGAAGDNGIGVAGVAWTASLAALKIFDAGGLTTDAAILDAVDYSNAMGMKITSNSWGGTAYSQSLFDLISEGRDLGHLFVASAGNSSADTDIRPSYPAGFALDNIIAVAATDRFDGLASFSNYGDLSVDLGAPGVDVLSCAPGGGYRSMSGTSMAAPHVSGAAYLIWSSNAFLTAAQVKSALMASVDAIPSLAGVTVTGGRLNLDRALQSAGPAWLTAGPSETGELPPGAAAPLRVTVNPNGLGAGTWTGRVVVATDDPAHPELSIAVTAAIDACRSLSVEPSSVAFGTRFLGVPSRAKLTLRNDCSDTTTVSAMPSSHPAFRTIGPTLLRVPPFGRLEVAVEFAPASAGPQTGTLTLTTDADTDPVKTVSLSGLAVDPPQPTVDPPSIARFLGTGRTAAVDLAIGNLGGSSLQWSLENVDRGLSAAYDAAHYLPQAKGAPDTRVGRPVLSASGGPDAFGYRWADSDGPGGPAYEWNDIRATGQSVVAGCDDCVAAVPLSFAFPLYDSSFNAVNVTSNGWVNFGTMSSQFSNYPLPSRDMPGFLVAGFFDDLSTSSGTVYFQDFGNRAVIQYQDVNKLGGDGKVTFQIVLNADGTILLYFENLTGSLVGSTTGIQNGSGDAGLTVQYNTTYLHNGLAVRFAQQPPWLRISDVSGSVDPGATQHLILTLDAAGLSPGVYSQVMTLSHNNPLIPAIPIPVTLTVGPVGVSRVLRIGPSALAAAAGSRHYLWNVTVGGEARGMLRGSRLTLYLK